MQYYWIEGKNNYEKVISIFDEKKIEYVIKTENKFIQIKELLCKKVYVFIVAENSISEVESLLVIEEKFTIDKCYSKHIIFPCPKKRIVNKKILKIIFEIIVCLLVILSPIDLIQNDVISTILMLLKFALIIISVIYTAKREPGGIIIFLLIEALALYLYSDSYFKAHSLEIIDIMKIFPRLYMCIGIFVMIITFLIGIFYGLKKYNRNSILIKIKFAMLIVGGYLVIMYSTIFGYANLFQNYHNEVFWNYQEKLSAATYIVKKDSTACFKDIKVDTDNGYVIIEGYYRKDIGSDKIDITPYQIFVSVYDSKGKFVKMYYLEPGINTLLQSDIVATSIGTEYRYFSFVTYFTIGYGDIYPVADIMKTWVIQEGTIAHIMSLLVIPLLFIIGQMFITEKKVDNPISSSISRKENIGS